MLFSGKSSLLQRNYRNEFLILLFTLITFFISVFYYNQSLSVFAKYLLPMSFIPYFYLIRNKVTSDTVEKILFLYGIIYFVCWLYQTSQLPNIVFGEREAEMNGRGFFRFYIVTKEHLPFLVFYFLALFNRSKNILFLALTLCFFCVIILHVTRQMILWSAVFAIAYYLHTNGKQMKNVILALIFSYIIFAYFMENFTVVNDLIDLTEKGKGGENSADVNNIRIKAMQYFITNFNDNPITVLFGNGFGSPGSSLSLKYMQYSNKGYYIDDVGFVGLFVTQGLIIVILYIKLLYEIMFKYKVSDKYLYLKFYIAYFVMSYLGSHALTSNIVFVVLAVYIIKRESFSFSELKYKNY